MIHLSLLGPPEVTVDGGPAPKELLWRKNLGILVYVSRAPYGRRSREHLASVFWGDKPEADARHSLNEALRVVRKQLPADAMAADGDQVVVDPGLLSFDLDRFMTLADDGDVDGAASLIRGGFMEGFGIPEASEFEDWLSAERRIWRQRCTDVLEAIATASLEAGDLSAARDTAHRAGMLDPMADSPVRVLMQCEALRGDPTAALATYQEFVERLERDLGVGPPESMNGLVVQIRKQREVADVEIRAEGAGLSRRLPLTGRGPELKQAMEVVRTCRRDARSALLLITGGPGTGKTRLAEEIILRAQLDGFHAVSARCDDADRKTPHGALKALVADAEVFGEDARFESPEALGDALHDAAASHPLIVWIDSAEHLDPDSYLAIGPLLKRVGDRRVTFILSAADTPGPPELDAIGSRIGRDAPGQMITLEPLDVAHLASLARRALPEWGDESIDRLARRLHRDTGGLPLLAVDMLHALCLGLELEDDATPWPEAARTMDQTFPGDIPAELGAAIRVGFRRLSANAQEVLKVGSLVEARLTADLLERATALDGDDLIAALDELEWRRWLTAEPRGYGFVARLHRDVIERDMMTKGQRQRLKESLAAT